MNTAHHAPALSCEANGYAEVLAATWGENAMPVGRRL